MAKIKKESKPIKGKLNTSPSKKDQKPKKDVKVNAVKAIKVKNIQKKELKHKIVKEKTVVNEVLKKTQVKKNLTPVKEKQNKSPGKKNKKPKNVSETKGSKDVKVENVKPKKLKHKNKKEKAVVTEDIKEIQVKKPIKGKLNTSAGKKKQKSKKNVKPKVVKVIKARSVKAKGLKPEIKKKATLNIADHLKKLQVDRSQLLNGIETLLKYFGKTKTKKIFENEVPVFAQLNCIKIPQGPNRRLRVLLKHPTITDKSEVCLFVCDLQKGRRVNHEATIEHYETLLKEKGVTSVTRIIPFRELKVEYDQHELKRRLCGYYDRFIADGRISGHLSHFLGQVFYEKHKLPIPIRMTYHDLRRAVDEALRTVRINLHSSGCSFGVQIGHSGMSADMLKDNLESVITAVDSGFPGGWNNIRSLYVQVEKSIAVPVYITLRSAYKITVPITKPLRPKLFKEVHGELSTKLDMDVSVKPTGEILLKKQNRKSEVEVEESEDDYDLDDINEEDDDKLAASAEEAYMAELPLKEKHQKTKASTKK